MAQFDLPLNELESYRPALAEPDDFDVFWQETLARHEDVDLAVSFQPVNNGLVTIDTFDVTFAGYGGHPVRGWLHLPVTRTGPLPVVVEYLGYGTGRGAPHETRLWADAGYAHFVMDTRGQGAETPDADPATGDIAAPGFLTRGVLDPRRYYYRRLYTDAVRAVAAARTHPDVDPARVVVTGTSQGGGITLAAAGLVPDLVAVMPDVPFLCHFARATTITDMPPYDEVTRFVKRHREHAATVARTMSYFDGAALARRANAPTLFSVGLMDRICPPSTVYAAFNHYGTHGNVDQSDKQIRVYPFNDHEGGGAAHEVVKLEWLADQLETSV
ncbi:acetylxylan esterase [Streptomyces poriferorum]|uniref:Acetylxylan esterase n=1 Tax=Streptomyces poriferorum TaxID=2798799 RepID=A0ABY9J2X2_9ACTN|nr:MULTISPECIES: acetylxylan esterase [Streptomyces]MBW5249066.1 acetylxylan esterase [Streptomyces poriferorum]MBW5257929.1 acetylxylan esterase [Streptomyces poriferorum]MDP5309789.1 acetylxylan esterase [Streptomyces sp. Alt4]WLQ46371.1 acetylxylan esterase [Streptomyces sp. Alt1]WLQ61031.1 acetylxylan esterase [Streptomyces sp. Alt2]